MDPEAVAAMVREVRAEWEALVAVLDAYPHRPLHDPESPSWTSRDVYAHLARWMEQSTNDLGRCLDGQPPVRIEGTDDEINARWQQEDNGLSRNEARRRAQQASERRIAAIEAVPSDRWDKVLEAIARDNAAGHYRAHRSFIVVAQS